jgi:hypothetical protein
MRNNKKFVFVLGAGASKDSGYPTGAELIETIAKYNNDNGFLNAMNNVGIAKRDVNIFVDSLTKSGLNSIDAFLTRVTGRKQPQPIDFEKIGRACISYAILYAEKESKRKELPFRFDSNWRRHLFSFFSDDYMLLTDGRVRFITFNYDLSLEYFIQESYRIRNYIYAMSPEERKQCFQFLNKIEILHLYGQIGKLAEYDSDNTGRTYGSDLLNLDGSRMFWRIAENIEIVRPDITGVAQNNFKLAQQYLSESDYVFFLGFGFDSLNMERLKLHEIFQTNVALKKFYVTAYEADNSSIYDFKNRIFHHKDLEDEICKIGKKEEKIVHFLKDNCFILSQLKD